MIIDICRDLIGCFMIFVEILLAACYNRFLNQTTFYWLVAGLCFRLRVYSLAWQNILSQLYVITRYHWSKVVTWYIFIRRVSPTSLIRGDIRPFKKS